MVFAGRALKVSLLVITPLTFLGGAFYSLDMLPSPWREITYFNPVVYLISGFRWSFYGIADVHIAISTAAILSFLITCILIARWMIVSGWRLKR